MKKILLLVIIFLLVGCNKTEINRNEFSRYMLNIKGEVVSFEQEILDIETTDVINFDVFEMGYYGSSNISYEFDDRGNAAYIIEKTPDGKTIVVWSTEYDDNNVVRIFKAEFEGLEEYNQITYDVDDKENVILKNNISKGLNQLIYKDEILEEYKVATTFDEMGRVIRTSNDVDIYGLEGSPLYDYNKDGYVSDVYWYDASEKINHVFIQYNEVGYMSDYSYVINSMSTIKKLEFDYIYDEKNNWIEQKITIDGIDKYVIKRTYTYRE